MKFHPGLFLAAVFCLSATVSLFADEAAPQLSPVCSLQDVRIDESSGIAASRKYSAEGLLWTHNDSGGKPQLFLFNRQGETVADVLLNGSTNIDWEDMAIAGDWMYVGDIGDNKRKRDSITIYRTREPQLDVTKRNQTLHLDCQQMTLKYPDGPRDCETLMATASGELILISKNGGPSRFYKTPRPFQDGATQTLEYIGEYAFTGPTAWGYLTTGGDLSADGSRFVVRTYTHAYEWQLPREENWTKALASTPRTWELPPAKQGEAICYKFGSPDSFFVSSEGAPAPIWEVSLTGSVAH